MSEVSVSGWSTNGQCIGNALEKAMADIDDKTWFNLHQYSHRNFRLREVAAEERGGLGHPGVPNHWMVIVTRGEKKTPMARSSSFWANADDDALLEKLIADNR